MSASGWPVPAGPPSRLVEPVTAPGVAGPVALAGVAAALGTALAIDSSWVPRCPLHQATGWWCPGCGLTRAVLHVGHGELGAALAANAMLPLFAAAAVTGWWIWLRHGLGRPTRWVPARAWWYGLVALTVVFTVLRNLRGTPFARLAP